MMLMLQEKWEVDFISYGLAVNLPTSGKKIFYYLNDLENQCKSLGTSPPSWSFSSGDCYQRKFLNLAFIVTKECIAVN